MRLQLAYLVGQPIQFRPHHSSAGFSQLGGMGCISLRLDQLGPAAFQFLSQFSPAALCYSLVDLGAVEVGQVCGLDCGHSRAAPASAR